MINNKTFFLTLKLFYLHYSLLYKRHCLTLDHQFRNQLRHYLKYGNLITNWILSSKSLNILNPFSPQLCDRTIMSPLYFIPITPFSNELKTRHLFWKSNSLWGKVKIAIQLLCLDVRTEVLTLYLLT